MVDSENLSLTIEFNMNFGMFHTAWASAEVMMDYAIGEFLRLTPEEIHLVTSGMEHGRKAMLLRNLIGRGKHPNRDELLRTLKIIQNESLRNVFAHSYILSDETTISFVERSRGGRYQATEHEFSLQEFKDHVDAFLNASRDFQAALGLDTGDEKFEKFLAAIFNASHKAKTSPVPPPSITL